MLNNTEMLRQVEETMIKVQEVMNFVKQNLQIPARDKLLGVYQKLGYIRETIKNDSNNNQIV